MSRIFNKNTHQRFLTILLAGIVKAVPEKIAFKGGTCAALFYGLPRFSFDLDFDILRPLEKRESDSIKEVMTQHGRVLEAREKLYTLFYLFDYGKGYPNIKLEFNKRVWKNNRYQNQWFMGLPLVIPDESTLVTNKFVALTDRKAAVARDLFDVWYLLGQGFLINEELLNERTGKSRAEYCALVMKYIKKVFTRKNVLQGLGETLDDKQKAWARDHLIEETLLAIESLLKFV